MDGRRIGPTQSGAATSLVVLLHGYGSNGADLAELAPGLATGLPQTAFVAPNAPTKSPNPGGYQWFPLQRLDPGEVDIGVRAAEAELSVFLDAEMARLKLAPGRLALVGFSQGAMMALHVGLRRTDVGAIVAFSGLLANPQALATEAKSAPPIQLIHGERDEVIPVMAMFAAAQTLAASGRGALWHMSPGLGHGIGPEEVAIARGFLAPALRGALK